MQWELVLAFVALVLMLEGLVALLAPMQARRWMQRMMELPDLQFRMVGLIAVTVGVVLLYVSRFLA